MTPAQWIAAADRAGCQPVVIRQPDGGWSVYCSIKPGRRRKPAVPNLDHEGFRDVGALLMQQGRIVPNHKTN